MKCRICGKKWDDEFRSHEVPYDENGKPVCKICGKDDLVEMTVTIKTYSNWDNEKTAKDHNKGKHYANKHEEIEDKLDWLPIDPEDIDEAMENHIRSIKITYKKIN